MEGRAGPYLHPPPPSEEQGAALRQLSQDPSSLTPHTPLLGGESSGRFLAGTCRLLYTPPRPPPLPPVPGLRTLPRLFSGPRAPSAGVSWEARPSSLIPALFSSATHPKSILA